jgi:ABC-type polysaccharide/polyol phosphate export permease
LFRIPENYLASYRQSVTVRDEVSIAGVAWPVYKLLALAIGLIVLVTVAVATSSAAPSVLAAAAAGTVVWLALSPFHSSDR